MKEQNLVKEILFYLVGRGHYVWRQNTGATSFTGKNKMGVATRRFVQFGHKGVSDILGVEKGTGRFIAIECKVGKNKPTQFQQDFLDSIMERGGIAIVAYSIDDVFKVL